jgi:hypothetical protein
MKIDPELAYYLHFEGFKMEVCQHDNATGSIGDKSSHAVCSLGRTRLPFAAA